MSTKCLSMNTVKILSPELCRNNPDTIFVFGDNLIKKGTAGQACIRNEPNAFGIPTKRLPSMSEQSFFSDQIEEWRAVNTSLGELLRLSRNKTVVFPEDGLGTGLAMMEEKSPKVFTYMNLYINRMFY